MNLINLTIDIETLPGEVVDVITVEDLPKSITRPEEIVNPKGYIDPDKKLTCPSDIKKLGEEHVEQWHINEKETIKKNNEILINE